MHRFGVAVCAALISLGANASAWAAKVGPEFRINTRTIDNQYEPAVARLANGSVAKGFVVVWTSMNQDGGFGGIYGQRYATTGAKAGPEFRVNTFGTGHQSNPAVAGLKNGGFVAVWTSDGQDGSGRGVYGQRYNMNGTRAGTEFRVNTTTGGNQDNASIAALSNGGFLVTWADSGGDVYAQRYNATFVAVGGEFKVNTEIADNQLEPAVAPLNGGAFVIVWQSFGQDGSDGGIYGQRFSAAGAVLGSEFRVNTTTANHQRQPAVAGLPNGGFVVAWTSLFLDGTLDNIRARRYSPAGAAQGNEFAVNVYKPSYQLVPSVAGLTDGGFVITWASNGSSLSPTEFGYGVLARRYRPTGAAFGGEFSVNTFKLGDQGYRGTTGSPAVAPLPDADYVITWPSYFQDTPTSDGVYGQRFN